MQRELKRYKNRKLYDTSKGYVGLQQVAEMVRAGEEVKVVDHATGQDRTGHVLAQALAQEELQGTRLEVKQKLLEALRATKPPVSPASTTS
jgi:polyhydroxyalkanoate synthesis repressor PhaR